MNNASQPVSAFTPNIPLKAANFSSADKFLVLSCSCINTRVIFSPGVTAPVKSIPNPLITASASNAPACASDNDKPSSCIALVAVLGGPASLNKPILKEVPAIEPLIPEFANIIVIAAVSSNVEPYAFATGPIYFIDSPRSDNLKLEFVSA